MNCLRSRTRRKEGAEPARQDLLWITEVIGCLTAGNDMKKVKGLTEGEQYLQNKNAFRLKNTHLYHTLLPAPQGALSLLREEGADI